MIKTVISVRQIAFLLLNIVYKLISPDQKRRLHWEVFSKIHNFAVAYSIKESHFNISA